MTTLTKLLYNPGKIIPGGFNIILNLSRRFDMRFINLILSNFIGQLTTSMVEIMYIIYMYIHVVKEVSSSINGCGE